ncbi:hypothetical protein GE061_004847 [Apolygus lucorum]|uniref:FLYWCH-type domain-containing protein n=1 Tax=Apolygus lucorum TaxID=248454 RepID=A0A8S9X0F0_APOLU|nr:hypothetical protein GE061_004847 [Apolygus lucorum]
MISSSQLEVVASKRSTAVIYERFKYIKQKVYSSGDIFWKCIMRNMKCSAFITTDSEMNYVRKVSGQHSHPALDPKEMAFEISTSFCLSPSNSVCR